MTRLSLSPEPEEWEQGRYRFRDDDSSDDSSEEEFVTVSSEDDCRYSDSEEEKDDDMVYEYPHPVGFPGQAHSSWGRTRLCLDPTMTSEHIEEEWDKSYSTPPTLMMLQSYPFLETSYIDPKTAPTSALLQYNTHQQRKLRLQHEDDRDMDQITQLLAAASIVDTSKVQALVVQPPQVTTSPLDVLASMAQKVQQKLKEEKRLMQKEQMEAARALQMLLDHNNRAADNILRKEQQQEVAENERLRKEEEEAERIRIQNEQEEADAEAARNAAQKVKDDDDAARKAQEDAAKAKEAAKTEYIDKAKKLVAQLVQLRASIEPFEKSKAVGKRRLNMKKIVRGKVNTLAENAEKIKSVASEVSRAIAEARAEDEELKSQLQAGNTQIAPEMTRGKRYLVDLLASSIMVRVQAEGFNGLRGDGFPIANMMALVSIESKELCPILAAHIYTVCPTAIPKLPTPASDSSEEGLMKSLGMSQDKNGEYETFNRFLQRTEGIISFVSNIMASNPPSHQLMGGHKGAVDWLTRFLRILPAPPQSPLPLLTASVLDAFLTGAGHMLANMHPEHFKIHLDVIANDIVNRLDESPIGAPSAHRLKKTVKEGFEGFKNKLPSKALPELYYGANGSSGGHGGGASHSSSGFGSGSATQSAVTPNPFGGGGSKPPAAKPDPFGGGSSQPANPFGGAPAAAPATPFGGGTSQPAAKPDPFSQPAGANPFGGGSSQPQAADPFGGAPAAAPATPFGGGGGFGQPQQQGFGQQQPGLGPSNSTPFGSSANATPFGGGLSAGQSGGMGDSNGMQDDMNSGNAFGNPSPFGGGGTSAPSPFSSQPMAANPFGGAPSAAPATPFGAPSSGFGAAPTNPFGGGGGFGQTQPQGLGQQQQGLGPSNSTPFGSSTNATPFGQPQANNNPSPFGASPFGGGGAPNPSPFSSNNDSSGFGGNAGGGAFGGGRGGGGRGGGGGNSAPVCKFFLKGQCKFGNNCRFQHTS